MPLGRILTRDDGFRILVHIGTEAFKVFMFDDTGIRNLSFRIVDNRIALVVRHIHRLGHLEGSYDSASGRYVSNWAIREDGSLSFHIEVPFGCTAEVCLPEQVPFVVETGVYDYTVRPEKNYRALYSAKTRFEDLVKDERAVAVLNECMPGFVESLDRTDNESMTRSLESELVRTTIFRQPNDHIQKAIAGISVIEE